MSTPDSIGDKSLVRDEAPNPERQEVRKLMRDELGLAGNLVKDFSYKVLVCAKHVGLPAMEVAEAAVRDVKGLIEHPDEAKRLSLKAALRQVTATLESAIVQVRHARGMPIGSRRRS